MTDNIKLPPYPEGLCLREDIEDYAREAVRLNAQAVPDGDAAEAVHDTNAVLASRYFELLKVVEAYEKHGVTCQTFRHFVDTPCAECNCAPAAPAAPAAPQPAQQPTDEKDALDLLAVLFDAYENGPSCYEDPDDRAAYIGNAIKIDDDTFEKCVDLLNRRRPRILTEGVKNEH